MNINRIRSIAAIFILVLMSGCVAYPNAYRNYSMPMGNGYGYGVRQPQYGNYGNSNYQQYQPNRERREYREHEQGGRGYGQYRRHDND